MVVETTPVLGLVGTAYDPASVDSPPQGSQASVGGHKSWPYNLMEEDSVTIQDQVAEIHRLVEALEETVYSTMHDECGGVSCSSPDEWDCGGTRQVPNQRRADALALCAEPCPLKLLHKEPCDYCAVHGDDPMHARHYHGTNGPTCPLCRGSERVPFGIERALSLWPEACHDALIAAWAQEVAKALGWVLYELIPNGWVATADYEHRFELDLSDSSLEALTAALRAEVCIT